MLPRALGSLVVAAALAATVLPAAVAVPNPIQRENALAGSAGWQAEQAPFRAVEGYASEVSVAPGDTIHFHVQTTPAARYRIELYRLGWYDGTGGRLVACGPGCATDEQGSPRPVRPFDRATGYLAAEWPVTDTLRVGEGWVSGYYLARVRLTSGPHAGRTTKIPLIVRELQVGRGSAILAQAPVNTWQAYNSWGGRSLYSSFDGIGSSHVSFERPYIHGEQDLFEWEYQMVRFLEREGYDVSYTTSVDLDRETGEPQRHRLFMSLGHDEYWTKTIRDALELARGAGTNLAFMGGNVGYWQMRYADNGRTIVEYRDGSRDPEPNRKLKTTLFRTLIPSRAECELLGAQWQGGIGRVADYPVNDAALGHPWFAGTGFTPGSVLAKVIGGEWDGIQPGCKTPRPTVFFHYSGENSGQPGPADTLRYVADSGARVFHAATLRFSWGLDSFGTGLPGPDTRLQQFMRNALDDLTRPARPALAPVRRRHEVRLGIGRRPDARVRYVAIYRHRGGGRFRPASPGAELVCATLAPTCVDTTPPPEGPFRYLAIARDPWGASYPVFSKRLRFR